MPSSFDACAPVTTCWRVPSQVASCWRQSSRVKRRTLMTTSWTNLRHQRPLSQHTSRQRYWHGNSIVRPSCKGFASKWLQSLASVWSNFRAPVREQIPTTSVGLSALNSESVDYDHDHNVLILYAVLAVDNNDIEWTSNCLLLVFMLC